MLLNEARAAAISHFSSSCSCSSSHSIWNFEDEDEDENEIEEDHAATALGSLRPSPSDGRLLRRTPAFKKPHHAVTVPEHFSFAPKIRNVQGIAFRMAEDK
jgi:hypothetical protein